MENNEKVEVRAYRGYYVNMDNIIPVITQLLADADERKAKIVIIGNDEKIKLDGAIMSLSALKEALYNLEVFGDLIPQTDPVKEVANDKEVCCHTNICPCTVCRTAPAESVPSDTSNKPI